MNKPRRKAIPDIFFVTRIGKKSISFSRSAIYSKRETQVIDMKNVVNETDSELMIGDRIIAELEPKNDTFQVIVKRIIAREQPIASSDKKYLKLLRIYIDDKNHSLDLQELNDVLVDILGIKIIMMDDTTAKNYHIIMNLNGEDSGTKRCPFLFSFDSGSYPFKIDFPQVSDETKRYLEMLYPDGNVTNTRIFAFRLIHFLLHKLGYHDHFDFQKIEEEKRIRKALREGDPSQVPVPDLTKFCLCDWELIHFVAVQPDPPCRSYEHMLCDHCRKMRIHVGFSVQDVEALFSTLKKISKHPGYCIKEKCIFYVIELREDGLVLNVSPYKSKTTIDIVDKDWNKTMFEIYEYLSNILVPNRIFDKLGEVRKGDKVLLHVETITRMREDRLEPMTEVRSLKIDRIIKKGVKIIDPSNLLSRIKLFRLGVTLKTGPDTDLNFIDRVAKMVKRLTGWHVEIDSKSSYNDLKNAFRMLFAIHEKWEKEKPSDRGKLVGKVNEITYGLAKTHEVEDSYKVIVYIFPEKYSFIEDIFGTIASGIALHRTFAAVSVFPSVPSDYRKKEPCRDCQSKVVVPFREEITSLFIIHEVLHIASGLEDHRNCQTCSYRRKEMQPFRRFHCEECIRKGNDQTHESCLMSCECLICISTRLSQERNLSDLLCEECKKKLLPEDQFAARQAARMNSLIYQKIFDGSRIMRFTRQLLIELASLRSDITASYKISMMRTNWQT